MRSIHRKEIFGPSLHDMDPSKESIKLSGEVIGISLRGRIRKYRDNVRRLKEYANNIVRRLNILKKTNE